jgi:hypothetical protein
MYRLTAQDWFVNFQNENRYFTKQARWGGRSFTKI